MKIRLAIKILRQKSPDETSKKCRAYWCRYYKALAYSDRLFNKWIRKHKSLLSDEYVDEIINAANTYFEEINQI